MRPISEFIRKHLIILLLVAGLGNSVSGFAREGHVEGKNSDQGLSSQNRFGKERSPYLLQHADNPAHWWAWEPKVFVAAKKLNKPIFLSIG